jgi:hypothetical protein
MAKEQINLSLDSDLADQLRRLAFRRNYGDVGDDKESVSRLIQDIIIEHMYMPYEHLFYIQTRIAKEHPKCSEKILVRVMKEAINAAVEEAIECGDTENDDPISDYICKYLNNRAHPDEIEDYLSQSVPEMSAEERKSYYLKVYKCMFCHRMYPIWYLPCEEWLETGGAIELLIGSLAEGRIIAKKREIETEELICATNEGTGPNYLDIRGYIEEVNKTHSMKDHSEEELQESIACLSKIWNLPPLRVEDKEWKKGRFSSIVDGQMSVEGDQPPDSRPLRLSSLATQC